MKLLTRNRKMKKSSGVIFNFTLPAYKTESGMLTCPNAGACVKYCYASKGAYSWPHVRAKHEANFRATQNLTNFLEVVDSEINNKRSISAVRIHDSGDFYSLDYLRTWCLIAKINPDVDFYAYTKQVKLIKRNMHLIPRNMHIVFSLGGKQDVFIDVDSDRHSKIFTSLYRMRKEGYVNASNDDAVAYKSKNNKIGLLIH